MNKKICIVCPNAYPHIADNNLATDGGAEIQLKCLGNALKSEGYCVHYIVDDYGQTGKIENDKITIHKVEFKYRGGSNLYLPITWCKLFKKLKQINADVHFIKFPRDLLFPLGLFAKFNKKRLIFIGQSDNDVNPSYIKRKENFFSYWFYRIGLEWVDNLIAQNEKQRIGFSQIYKKNALIIKSFLTLPEKVNTSKLKDYILWVGNNQAKKQPEMFLKLAKIFPNYNFKMIMAPTRNKPDDNYIKSQTKNITNLEYLGYVPFSKIADYFQKACLTVNTSLQEGFPNTFLQSWQNETPVVSLYVDPDKIIERFGTGTVSSNFDRLCIDIKTLMENKKIRNKMGKNARDYVIKNHSAEVIVSQYLQLIQE